MNEQKYNCHERRLVLPTNQWKIKLAYAPDIGSDNYLEIIETDMQGNRKYINNDVDRCYNKTIKFTKPLRHNSVIDIWYNKKEIDYTKDAFVTSEDAARALYAFAKMLKKYANEILA